MLIEFKVENFLSYNETTSFSMVAGKERISTETLASVKKFRLKLLPVAAIYGANASGKSNLIKALEFLQLLVTTPRLKGKIPLRSFCFTEEKKTVSRFEISILVNELIYEFKIACSENEILYEELIERNSRTERTLYVRDKDQVQVNPGLKAHDAIQLIAERSMDNPYPLLTSLCAMKFELFQPVFKWFAEDLQIIFPDSFYLSYDRLTDVNDPRNALLSEILKGTDTGISNLVSVPIEATSVNLSPSEKNEIRAAVSNGRNQVIREPNGGRILAYYKDGDVAFKRIIAIHDVSGKEYPVALEDESDGTRRLIDLSPSIADLVHGNEHSVYVIDEIDRSLHSDINLWLITKFLENLTPESRSQLIFTTHDTNLLRRINLRRDEIWFVERGKDSSSHLVNASEFEGLRNDSSLQKLYEEGRFGAIPNIIGQILLVQQAKDWCSPSRQYAQSAFNLSLHASY